MGQNRSDSDIVWLETAWINLAKTVQTPGEPPAPIFLGPSEVEMAQKTYGLDRIWQGDHLKSYQTHSDSQ